MLNKAVECGCTQADSDMLFSILDVPCPDKINLGETADAAQSDTCVEKKSWWTMERIVIVAAASLIFIGLLLLILGSGNSNKTSKSSYAKQSISSTKVSKSSNSKQNTTTEMTASYASQDENDAVDLVKKWNYIHNSKKSEDFDLIYASLVNFYQQTYTPGQIIKAKLDLFEKTPGFKQELSDYQVTVIDQNAIKVHFNKKVWTSSKEQPKTYPSYLVVRKYYKWLIVEESDDITDANMAKKK
jgi:hypothetical protein